VFASWVFYLQNLEEIQTFVLWFMTVCVIVSVYVTVSQKHISSILMVEVSQAAKKLFPSWRWRNSFIRRRYNHVQDYTASYSRIHQYKSSTP